ncbi:MAG: PLP-dependent aminotransferase family protein [Acidimicrobiales bacterium]
MFTESTVQIAAAIERDGDGENRGHDGTDARTARRIAATIGRMISAGSLAVGTRLPTVRELSRRLGVSPTTVSEAWRSLADVGAIETRGRNGTFVRTPTGPGGPRRYRQVTEGPGHFALDLSTGTPDPELLPDLAPIIARVGRQTLTSSYLDNPVLPELEEELRATWPFPPEALTVVDGALDAIDRVVAVALRLGDRVVVEHPTFPPMLDLLERLSCHVASVDVDDAGMNVEQLRSALAGGPPAAVLLQPRAQNPAGVAMSERRAKEIAELLRPVPTLVIEDDHANNISSAPLVSVGQWLPERTVHIRSFSKSHGPDLRLGAVGGAGNVVRAVENRRLLGPGWSSRILQSVLLDLLRDPSTDDTLAAARAAYTDRRRAVSRILARHGVDVTGTDGINLWMAVGDERSAVVALAARGIGVAPGHPFLARPDDDHIRVTVGLLGNPAQLNDVAEHLAAAATMRGARSRPSRSSHR